MKTRRRRPIRDVPDAVQKSGRELFRVLLRERSLAERLEPVWRELTWIMRGRPESKEHEMALPGYCYNIFDVYRRTYLRAMPMYPNPA